jgi:hypothetical protein
MKLHCPECGQPIPAADINLSTLLAKCGRCDAVFDFRAAVPAGERHPPGGPPPLPPITPLLPKSNRFRVEEFGGVLRIHYRWFTPVYIFLAFFCVAWDGFLIFWYSIALGTRAPWIMAVFPIVHVAVGLGLTYATLAGFLNSTTVEVGQGSISIRHFPLPWKGNRTLASDQVVQLHCEQKRSQSKNGVSITYDLFATMAGGEKLKLLGGFTDPAEPKQLEIQIERHLRIPNRSVVGEYRG